MNESFTKKCEDPIQFNKIRYLVHSFDTDKMHKIILEMIEVNPYLAVLCYNTAEQDNSLRAAIINHLNKIEINNLHQIIIMCLAWESIIISSKKHQHSMQFIVEKCRPLIRKLLPLSRKEQKKNLQYLYSDQWQREPAYWIDNFFRCVLRTLPSRIRILIEKAKINVSDYSEEIIAAGKFKCNVQWLQYVEDSGLFGKLDSLNFHYETDYEKLITSMISLSKLTKFTVDSILKLTAIGFIRNELSVEYAKIITSQLSNTPLNRSLNMLCYWYNKLFNSPALKNNIVQFWDIEKNVIPFYFAKKLIKRKIIWWWKCSCGHSWKAPIEKSTIMCEKCGKRIVITSFLKKGKKDKQH